MAIHNILRFLKLFPISKGIVRLWLLLSILALCSFADVMEFAAHQSGALLALIGLVCAALFKSSVLTALYVVCRNRFVFRIFVIILIAIFCILSILNGGCWLFYGFGISRKLFTIIAETNAAEVGEFIPELVDKFLVLVRSIWFWIFFIMFLSAWILIPKISQKLLIRSVGIVSAVGFFYLIYVFTTADFGRTDHSIYARSYRCVANYMRDREVVRELQTKKRPLPHPESLFSFRAAERIVVIIGESASRDHLSLYGYPLPTSPRLDTISNGLYKFDDAIASSTSTAQNMPRLISFMTDEPGGKEWYEYPSLLQIFHQLGYQTYWLSNQEYSGKWSNLSSILSADADVVKYVGSIDSEDHYLVRHDDILLPEWQKAVVSNDSLQLIFIHLMGSHFQYAHRFPDYGKHFVANDIKSKLPRKWLDEKKAGIIADYDNSILFTDSIISVVMDGVRDSKQPTLVVYFSDHGENVYDDRDYRGRDPKYVKVPFVIYANDEYRRENPDIITDIEKARSNSFSTSELPQMLLHLSGTKYIFYDSIRDPISPHFEKRKRYVDDEPYDKG